MRSRSAVLVTALGVAMAIAGCGPGTPAARTADGHITVTASTNVWGSVASAVGGAEVAVTSIISDPAADPHSHQLTPKDAADLARAQLVVFNGGGYDEFIEQAFGEGGQGPQVVMALAAHKRDTET